MARTKKFNIQLVTAYKGMPKEELYRYYNPLQQKDYRSKGGKEWIVFRDCVTGETDKLITFKLINGKVEGWSKQSVR